MKNMTTSKRGNQPTLRPKLNLYAEDSSLLNGMCRKYEGVDQEVFDAFIDLRELLLIRVGRGMKRST